jgi:hypothetical protein
MTRGLLIAGWQKWLGSGPFAVAKIPRTCSSESMDDDSRKVCWQWYSRKASTLLVKPRTSKNPAGGRGTIVPPYIRDSMDTLHVVWISGALAAENLPSLFYNHAKLLATHVAPPPPHDLV